MPDAAVEHAQERAVAGGKLALEAIRRGDLEAAIRWFGDAQSACYDAKRLLYEERVEKSATADALLLAKSGRPK